MRKILVKFDASRLSLPYRKLTVSAAAVATLTLVGVAGWYTGSDVSRERIYRHAGLFYNNAPVTTFTADAVASTIGSAPGVLSSEDAQRYQQILTLQARREWAKAANILNEVRNPVLAGYVLAERYLSPAYPTRLEEIAAWLADYGDQPQAKDIYRLGISKNNGSAKGLPEAEQFAVLSGYGDTVVANVSGGNRLNAIPAKAWADRAAAKGLWKNIRQLIDSEKLEEAVKLVNSDQASSLLTNVERDVARWETAAHYLYDGKPEKAYPLAARAASASGEQVPSMHWIAGISAWQMKDKKAAYEHFSRMAEAESAPWEKSAAAFWAWRAGKAIGRSSQAAGFLEVAAENPRTFYGMIATKALKRDVHSPDSARELSRADTDILYQNSAVRRAVALSQIGRQTDAEEELRRVFPQMKDRNERERVLKLAHTLNLSAVQISMANVLKRGAEDDITALDYALYPMPKWEPKGGFAVEPALIFAFGRQESGFRPEAKSPGGALGVMQIMPETARYMTEKMNLSLTSNSALLSPQTNLALGQSYLDHLLTNPLINGNLIYLAAAYNAGPGKLAGWKQTSEMKHDPLLFLESIPYGETRHYVKQVLTAYWVYQALDGREPESAEMLAKGDWPVYQPMTASARAEY